MVLILAIPVGIAGAQASDDNIPNAAVLAWGSDQRGELNRASDTDDVYRFDLKRGALINVSMTGADKTDFDLYLFGPGSVNILDDEEIAASETSGTSTEAISHTAGSAGTYYLDVATWDTDGSYTLKVRVRPTLSISRNSVTFDYANERAVALSGIMDPPRAGVTVKIKVKPAGRSSFSTLGSASVGSDGRYRFEIKKPTSTANYRADWAGDSAFLAAQSPETRVQVKPVFIDWSDAAKEIASTSSTSTTLAKQVALSGRVKAASYLPDGERVAVEVVDPSSGKVKQTLATVKTSAGKGWFSYTFSSGTPGEYQIRARYVGSGRWLSEASRNRKVTVLP